MFPTFQVNFPFYDDGDIDEFLEKFLPAKKDEETKKDYCYNCKTDELYWHAMTAKCTKCDQIILGGSFCQDEKKKKLKSKFRLKKK